VYEIERYIERYFFKLSLNLHHKIKSKMIKKYIRLDYQVKKAGHIAPYIEVFSKDGEMIPILRAFRAQYGNKPVTLMDSQPDGECVGQSVIQ
jgi:hypothetical protein